MKPASPGFTPLRQYKPAAQSRLLTVYITIFYDIVYITPRMKRIVDLTK